MRKYTDEEKLRIQEIKAKYEKQWEEFLSELKRRFEGISWNSDVNEEDLPEELGSFIESYFDITEEIEVSEGTEPEVEDLGEIKNTEGKVKNH